MYGVPKVNIYFQFIMSQNTGVKSRSHFSWTDLDSGCTPKSG